MTRKVGRYEKLVRGIKEFAASSVSAVEDELATLDASARKSAVRYLRLAAKELRLLEKELGRIEKSIALEPSRRKGRMRRAKPVPRAITTVAAA